MSAKYIEQLKLNKENKKVKVVELLKIEERYIVVYHNRVNRKIESFEYQDLNMAESFFNELCK